MQLTDSEQQTKNSSKFIIFKLAGETMGIPVHLVREVINLKQHCISRIPGSPHYFTGTINLRGQVIPIIDTRKKFNFGLDLPPPENPQGIILEKGTELYGLMVDSVEEVAQIEQEDIEIAPGHLSSLNKDRKIGRICGKEDRDRKQFVFIMYPDSLFN